MFVKKRLSVIYITALLITLTSTAYAEDEDIDKGWEFELSLGAESEPTYVGSDKSITELQANFEATYRTDYGVDYFIGLGEVGASFSLGNDWELTSFLEFEEGRDNSEDDTLEHFPEVEDTIEGQFILAKHINDWTIAGVFQPDLLGRGKGLVYFFALGLEQELTQKLSLDTRLDISFADAEHINTEVGISDSVAALSGLDPYTASGGYKSTTLGLQLEYAFNEKWAIVTNADGEFYGKNVADSPLVRDEGTDINYTLGLGVTYSF